MIRPGRIIFIAAMSFVLLSCGSDQGVSSPKAEEAPYVKPNPGTTPAAEWEKFEIRSSNTGSTIQLAYDKKSPERIQVNAYPSMIRSHLKLVPVVDGKDFSTLCENLQPKFRAIVDTSLPESIRERIRNEIKSRSVGVNFPLYDFLANDQSFRKQLQDGLSSLGQSVSEVVILNPLVLREIALIEGGIHLTDDAVVRSVRGDESSGLQALVQRAFYYGLPNRNPNRAKDSLELPLVDLLCDIHQGRAFIQLRVLGEVGGNPYEGKIIIGN